MAVKLFHKLYPNNTSDKYLIILHGLFGMLDNWHNMATDLSEYLNVITVDLRNHGHSPKAEEMSYELMSEDVVLLMDDLKIDQATILGHSMGGKTAMCFADLYPERLNKLIVVDIAPKAYKAGHEVYFKAFKAIDFSKFNRRKEADEAFKQFEDNVAIRQFLLKNLERSEDGYSLKINVDSIYSFYPKMIDELSFQWVINIPALFIHGSKSAYLLESDKDQILNVFPQAEFAKIQDAGHWVHAEKPKAFFTTVLDFLI